MKARVLCGTLILLSACSARVPGPELPPVQPAVEPASGATRAPLLDRMQALDLDSITRGVTVYYSTGTRERAEVLGPLLAEARQFFVDSLGISLDLRLALLDEPAWNQLSRFPYGLPHIERAEGINVAVLPARPAGVVYDDFLKLEPGLSPDLRARLRATGLSWAEAVGQMVDLIGLHELGHAVIHAYGIGRPARWFDEFMASYLGFTFMDARRPDLAGVWDLMAVAKVEGYTPGHRTLDDFERLYAGVGPADYGWYQSAFEVRANPLVREQGLTFVRKVREIFPAGTERLPPAEVLRTLETIAPGFEQWAVFFQPAADGPPN